MTISVILWNRGDVAPLRRCIQSLLSARGGDQLQIIAAVCPPQDPGVISTAPNVTILNVEGRANHAMLRARAMESATGTWFFFTEPYCTFSWDFVGKLHDAATTDAGIIGGGVAVSDNTSAPGWASALFEFAPFMQPCGEAARVGVTTNNVMIRRTLLEPISRWQRDGFWKYFFMESQMNQGAIITQQPDRIVLHHPPYNFRGFLRRTFHHARVFASMRSGNKSAAARYARALCFIGVPIVMYLRLLCSARTRDSLAPRVILLAPHLLAIYAAWALGEACGFIAGPGDSVAEVY
ncbi:hypothetical protein IT570_03740 [Candidatus Sumerlaeota bacterium]|nr:hypothetical protein [Candidatus Sumerlaeota bacterium]